MNQDPIEIRRAFVAKFHTMMFNIWRERLSKLNVWDTGALFSTIGGKTPTADADFTTIKLRYDFLLYGIYVDSGSGKGVSYQGIHRERKNPFGLPNTTRVPRRWYSNAWWSSVQNLKEFMAESFGQEAVAAITNALNVGELHYQFSSATSSTTVSQLI